MTAPSNHSGFAENADRTTSCYETASDTQGGNDLSGQACELVCKISKTQGWASAHRLFNRDKSPKPQAISRPIRARNREALVKCNALRGGLKPTLRAATAALLREGCGDAGRLRGDRTQLVQVARCKPGANVGLYLPP